MDPINYNTAVLNPLQMALQGYQAGQQGRAGEQQMQIATNQDQRAQEELQLVRDKAASDAAADAEAKAGQQAMVALYSNPSPKPDDFRAAMAANPSAAADIRAWWDKMDPPQQDNNLLFGKQLAYALGTGRPEVARSILEERIMAAENAPDGKQTADTLKSQLHMLDMGGEGAKSLLMTTMGGLSTVMPADEFNAFTEKAIPVQTADEKQAAEIAKLKAETDKLNAETAKIVDPSTGQLDPKAKLDTELNLNEKYNARSKNYLGAVDAFAKITAAADAKTGPGDVALITSFMKMLDPNSVVRETEFATARDTNGLYNSLMGWASKVQSGELLPDDARANYVSLAKQYMAAANEADSKVRAALMPTIKNYGLNPDNVFGVAPQTDQAAAQPGEQPAAQQPAAQSSPPQGPQAGEVRSITRADGTVVNYRFKGGDPANKDNWEVVP